MNLIFREEGSSIEVPKNSLKVMDGQKRDNIYPGLSVSIIQKQDQQSGKLTNGIVQDVLTNSAAHPRGIKVRLKTGEVGRVQHIDKS